ncbi:conserved membrane protein of unknown function [Modestobacter italicus]|uniref:Integral membrane protein n=1 Tax=Modestobacter italicus (strain DSM 44449 / CECT 9708 / BC 501) TaxID=2732864 RepID=I4EUA7_MODI5|nr:DUF389 domain-containing protein [Modestobacter marinus]CCH86970.1 conserved membrane protein of unknown function [Modestobacter marinus]
MTDEPTGDTAGTGPPVSAVPPVSAPRVVGADIDRMTERLFLREARARSAFWVLLLLAAVIAAAGVVADSVATVIGAMIVAPLMTPILGTALAVVLSDRRQLMTSVGFVLAGALAVVAVGCLLGLAVDGPVVAETNDQVAGRVSPKLIDLISALATGGVGAFALVRSDVSDALPGVAIAISLVPPLAVVGLTLESGEPGQSLGALLLFGTNVTAIIATATGLLLACRVRAVALDAGRDVGRLSARTLVVVAGLVVLVAIPLGVGSYHVITEQRMTIAARPVAERWAAAEGWDVAGVAYVQGRLQIAAVGPAPTPDPDSLRAELSEAGLAGVPVRLSLVVGGTQDLPAPAD